jgi:ornithine decarboxylase
MDCITRTANLPELQIGDWLVFDDMGAYTVVRDSSPFSTIPKRARHMDCLPACAPLPSSSSHE